jgi:predicted DNA-binding protein (MmcQ/YjbR family)
VQLETLRRFCLSLPRAREKLRWGDNLCFQVNGKLFAIVSLDAVPQRLCFKCSPQTFDELLERDGTRPAPYLGRYKWIALEGLDVVSPEELRELISASYEMVTSKT